MDLVRVNKSNLTYMDDIVNKQNIGQDLIKEYINYNNVLSSTTNKNMKYDSRKDTEKIISKVIMLYQRQQKDALVSYTIILLFVDNSFSLFLQNIIEL